MLHCCNVSVNIKGKAAISWPAPVCRALAFHKYKSTLRGCNCVAGLTQELRKTKMLIQKRATLPPVLLHGCTNTGRFQLTTNTHIALPAVALLKHRQALWLLVTQTYLCNVKEGSSEEAVSKLAETFLLLFFCLCLTLDTKCQPN